MTIVSFFETKKFKILTWLVAGGIVFLLVFRLGIAVGYRKASFSYRWGENYHRNFGGPRGGFVGDFMKDRTFIESNGVFGKIVHVASTTLVVQGRDNAEKIVGIRKDTVIRRLREDIQVSDLKTDDPVVIIGNPNDAGQIEAKLIRVMPLEKSHQFRK